MTFDKEEHRKLLMEMFTQLNFPGQFLELAYELKQAAMKASIETKVE